jgi:hypothetical protein
MMIGITFFIVRYIRMANQSKAFLDSTFTQGDFYIGGDILQAAPAGDVEPEFLTVRFHDLPEIIFGEL